jgi:lipopolysaccharide/colanic/teichoic acid biosynthesis glycosyltransferase
MDRTAALLCLVFLSPIFFFTAILLYLFYGSPIIFPQERLGINKKIFLIYKFRSMKSIASDEYKEFPDNARLTPLYRFIRRFKIDELPQLYNILIGDMSFVGPRPWMPAVIKQFSISNETRFNVKPGLTGLAQINGNTHLSFNERLKYDIRYISQISLFLDLRIILSTFAIVCFGEKWGLKK